MSWSTSSAYAPTVARKPTSSSMTSVAPSSSLHTGSVCVCDEASGPVRTTDQASGDLVLPMVIWSDPPQVEIACLHVLYLPMSQPSQNSSDLMNRWPSLASFVQQWSSQQHLSPSGSAASLRSLNSAHSMINLQRVLSRQKNKRASLTPAERDALIKENGGVGDLLDDDDFQYVDDGDMDGDDELYQLCVFAGTADGKIVYWLFEQDVVVQVSLLVQPTAASTVNSYPEESKSEGSASPVVSIVSGIDEWGQSNMISVSRDGSVARWELPNGSCSRADVCLAGQLAPVKGMETFCNNRYAIVYGEQSRMMVLDTWKLVLLYCVDTAQEQVRRGIAVVELKMPLSNARKTVSASMAETESPSRRVSDNYAADMSSKSSSSFVGASSQTQQQVFNSGSFSEVGLSSNVDSPSGLSRRPRSISNQMWDSLVLSLGSEGLIKCFLWSKPRGGSSSATSVGCGTASGSYQWMQESCWVISWADEADDITCSQSTSLKDGDNMNPQTALMRSIKSSYFPRSLRISSDASLLLFVWDTKWVILKRKWLCDISPPGTSPSVLRGTSRSASWKEFSSSSTKQKPSKFVGSCRVHPAEFLGHQVPGTESVDEKLDKPRVWWEDGCFLDDNQIVLWTNTGHVFQFPVGGSSQSQAGKLFMFTKAQDQLVPRSYHKTLNAVHRGEFVAYMHQCECCRGDQSSTTIDGSRSERLRRRMRVAGNTCEKRGFTSCAFASDGGGATRSLLSSSNPTMKLLHMCRHGSVGSWSLSPGNGASSAPSSPNRRRRGSAAVTSITSYERVVVHSLADGFCYDREQPKDVGSANGGSRRAIVTHLVLGREGARSSSSAESGQLSSGAKRTRRTHRSIPKDSTSSAVVSGTNGSSTPTGASNIIANALSPVSAFFPTAMRGRRRSSIGGVVDSAEEVYADFLLDVPIVVKGYTDGSLEYSLLASTRESKLNNAPEIASKQASHEAKVRSIAHCCWPTVTSFAKVTSAETLSIARSTATGYTPSFGNARAHLSTRIAQAAKRGTPTEDSCLASGRNPFYRARHPPTVQRRSASSRHLSIHQNGSVHPASKVALPAAPTSFKTASSTSALAPSLNFFVFSGCEDGVLCISELNLQSTDNSSFALDAPVLQRFKKHRGSIKEILISPWTREIPACPERYVATIGEDNTVNVYAPVFLHNQYSYGAASSSSVYRSGRIGVEWECVMELCEHPDAICSVEWLTERGQLHVECVDGMVYIWSLDTGVLERSLPCAVLYDGGNASTDTEGGTSDGEDAPSVECSKMSVGDSSLHLIKFNVNKSAEVIKTNWKAYYYGILNAESSSVNESVGNTKFKPPFSSPYAVGSIELLLLAFLLSWGASPDIDRACRQLLGLNPPQSLFSCVLLDDASGALSIPLPWKSVFSPMSSKLGEDRNPFSRKWQHSPALSATVALGIVSLCMNLMEHKYTKAVGVNDTDPVTPSSPTNKEEFHVLWSQLITQHSVVLPDYVPFVREPSLEYLAKHGFHPCEYTQLAARALMNSAIKRLHPPTRAALCAEYSAKLHCEIVRVETETGGKLNGTSVSNTIDAALTVNRLGSLVILLSMIGTCYPGEISPAGAREVCDILVSLLRASLQHVASVAAELLTKGLMLFRPHLVDLSSLITQLLFIDLREKQRNPGGESPTFGSNARVLASGGSNAALSLLVELGACETAFVLNLLQHEMNNADRPHAFRECILLYLTELINTHYLLMFRHLPSVIDTVMHCLDPTKPERRKRCLELSTRCLHNLVRRFPMVDFHKETQRLAIGTVEAVILIYDLRTATKWRVLDGHSSAVSAVAFRGDGQILVSYAAREGSVRWWNSGNAGLFGGMLKLQQSCIKEHKLNVIKSLANAPSSSGGASGDLKQVIQTCRFQFLFVKEGSNGQPGNSPALTSERKVLRLTREDASQVQFLM